MGDKTIEIKFGEDPTIISFNGKNYDFGNPFQINNYRTFHKYRIPNKFGKAIEFQYNKDNLKNNLVENEIEKFCKDNSLSYLCPVQGINPAIFIIHLKNNYEILIK